MRRSADMSSRSARSASVSESFPSPAQEKPMHESLSDFGTRGFDLAAAAKESFDAVGMAVGMMRRWI